MYRGEGGGEKRFRGLLKRFRDINRPRFKTVARGDDVRARCRYAAIADQVFHGP